MAPTTPKAPAAKPAAAKAPKPAQPSAKAAAKPAKPAPKPAKTVTTSAAKAAGKGAAKAGGKSAAPITGVKLRDLVESVATATGTKKVDAKVTVEATLTALAAALKAGADVNLPPLGKIRVVKLDKRGPVTMMTLKLRHGAGQKPGAKPLADDGEDS